MRTGDSLALLCSSSQSQLAESPAQGGYYSWRCPGLCPCPRLNRVPPITDSSCRCKCHPMTVPIAIRISAGSRAALGRWGTSECGSRPTSGRCGDRAVSHRMSHLHRPGGDTGEETDPRSPPAAPPPLPSQDPPPQDVSRQLFPQHPPGVAGRAGRLQPCKIWAAFLLLSAFLSASLPYLSAVPVPVPPGEYSSLLHPALRLWEHPWQPGPLDVVETRVSLVPGAAGTLGDSGGGAWSQCEGLL